jgi:hypothetical protein
MGSGGETKITNIRASPSTITPHNYIFLLGNAELQGWARSSDWIGKILSQHIGKKLRKLICACLIALSLVLIISLPVIIATAKQNNTSPLLEKITFVHYLSDSDHSKPV